MYSSLRPDLKPLCSDNCLHFSYLNVLFQSPAAYGCGPVIGVQVPMWAHVPQTSPAVIGNMMPYPTQPLQYQPCFMPPLQHTNHGMYFNNQMQSYSIVPHQYIPVPNRGFRQHFPVGQPPNVPYVLPHDYVPVANSGFAHTMGGTPSLHPQFLPTELHAREAVYEMSTVQQAQYVHPQCATPVQQYKQMSGVVQKRAGIVNQHTYVTREDQEIQKMLPNSEEQSGVGAVHLLQEEESSEMHKPVRSDVNTVPASSEQAPTPPHQHILDSTESIQVPHQHMLDSTESNQVPHQHMLDSTESIQGPHQHMLASTESMQAPHQLMLDSTESMQPDAAVSPSQMTLVPSPSSSDGVQTVCSSPVQSDSEEDDMTAAEDDQIPTKDTSDDVTPHHFSVEVYNLDDVERLEPEQLYDSARFKQEQCNSFSQTKEEINGLQSREISGSSSVTQGAEVTSQHSFIKHSAQPCISSENMTSTNQIQRHHHQPIRSLIDTPVYNTAHSRVLNQLAQPDTSSAQPHKGTPTRPLTTHFRQLFKPIPYSATKSATKEDRRS